MAITVVCRECQHSMRVADEHAGKKIRCKGCSQPVRVPTLEPLEDLPLEPSPSSGTMPPPLRGKSSPTPARATGGSGLLSDRRVQIGLAAALGVVLLVFAFSMFGGAKSSDGTGLESGGNGSSTDAVADRGGAKPEEPPRADDRVPAEAGEAAAVLPPPPPPFKHEALAKQAASGSMEQRNTALAKLGENGPEARPAAHVLCEAILNKETREAALLALEKVHPALYKPIVALVVDNNPWNHQQASKEIAALKREGAAAVPVLVWHLLLASRVSDPQHPFYNQSENLVGADLGALAAVAPRNPAVVKLLIEHTQFKRPDGKPGVTVRQSSIDGLGEVAFEFPEHRDAIVLTLIAALVDADLQKNALAAAAKCSTRSAPLKPVLQKLKLNPDAQVRQAADAALAEIELRVEYVPQLLKAGIKENLIPHPLYEWAFSLVSGKSPLEQSLPQLPEAESTELYHLFTYMCLSRVADTPTRKQTAVRKLAMERLIPLGVKEKKYRKYVAPFLVSALADPACEELAVNGLSQIGEEGTDALLKAKTPAAKAAQSKFEILLLGKLSGTNAPETADAILALSRLDTCSPETMQSVLRYLGRYSTSPNQEVIQAAAGFVERHAAQLPPHAELIFRRIQEDPDGAAAKHLRAAFAKLGIDPSSELTFWATFVAKPEHPEAVRIKAADWLWKHWPETKAMKNPAVMAGMRTTMIAMSGLRREKNYRSDQRNIAVFLAMEFGPEAQEVVPLLADWIEEFTQGKGSAGQVENAVIALEKIGPGTGPDAKAALTGMLASNLSLMTRQATGRGRGREEDTGRKQAIKSLCRRILDQWEGKAANQEQTPAPQAPDGAVLLFNGLNLDGWEAKYRDSLDSSWEVDPQRKVLILRGNNTGGVLRTQAAYSDFVLHLDFRFLASRPSSQHGSGVVVRSKQSSGITPLGIECQIAEHATGDLHRLGGDARMTQVGGGPPLQQLLKRKDVERPAGEWNKLEISCQGDKLSVKLNGQLINEAAGLPLHTSQICLLDQNSYVEFRNIWLVGEGEPVRESAGGRRK